MKTLLLVDGMAYVYRAFYAIPYMASPSGLPTNATYGFVRMLQRMVTETVPEYMAVAFDAKEPTFRHVEYTEYKAQRPPMPAELAEQLPWVREYVRALNVACVEYPGYEADDVIATLAQRGAKEGCQVLIATSDKDLCQLVSPQIAILRSGLQESEVLDARAVREKFGVEPEQMVDYLILVGDSSDNVPGVPGIGPKTAQALLREYGTLENVYAHLEEVKAGIREKLRAAKGEIARLRTLLTVHSDVPIKETLEELRVRAADEGAVGRLRAFLGFGRGRAGRAGVEQEEPQAELF
ncbi:MAG: 5'-3' exonuclease [bacterium]|nr:5'-3' exonuclease [bacterium]